MPHLLHLIIVILSVLGALSADVPVVNVTLTDPNITLVGNARSQKLRRRFLLGSDIQVELVSLPNEDAGILAISPEDAWTDTKRKRQSKEPPPFNCSTRAIIRYSSRSGFQLSLARHTLNLTNIPDDWGRGDGIMVIGLSYFPDLLPSSFPRWSQNTGGINDDGIPNFGRIAGMAVGIVGGVIVLLCLGEVIRRRLRKARNAKKSAVARIGLLNVPEHRG
ncbi:hypothetical protein M407DRAFT_7397 [Tulasnella calospora MUT 4182]|uniref:Uncharacterized protein n=1 Tax=Tulasnella calospora MUT 4182 TaxID=1051891 RepID=A0A0C3QL19_9AGAM|nr:hypothetical protein M407DRAFT_7397 [Tulasnella calospora MUT 4182]